MKIKNVKMIEVQDWNKLVRETYGRPYHFQQQDGCRDRGTFDITIPSEYTEDDEMNESIPEEVNGSKMGVKFKTWLERDPKKRLSTRGDRSDLSLNLFWTRNFYPDVHTVANDLYEKGLIKAGSYIINIDW